MKFLPYVTSCRIELLGGLKVKYGSSIKTQFRTQKTATLLAYLALHPGEHSREALIELLWPECTLEAGRNSLNVSLNSLRTLFNSLYKTEASLQKEVLQRDVPNATSQPFLIADRHIIALDPDHVIVDVHQFERRLQAAALSEESPGSLALLCHALDSYDHLLPNFYEDWLLNEGQRLETLYFVSLQKLLSRLRRHGDTQLALLYARRGLAFDPTREEIQREVMSLLLSLGQATAAYQQYKSLEELLQKRYEVLPDAATRQLARQIQDTIQNGQGTIRNRAEIEDTHTEDAHIKEEGRTKDASLPGSQRLAIKAFTIDGPESSSTKTDYPQTKKSQDFDSLSVEAQVQALVLTYFENISQRRACDNLSLFLRPDATVTGVSEGGGVEIIWHYTAEVHLDFLQRELTNLAVDTPFLVDAMQIQAIGILTMARVFVVNPWVYSHYLMTMTTEGGTPRITSITLASCPPMRFSDTDPFVQVNHLR